MPPECGEDQRPDRNGSQKDAGIPGQGAIQTKDEKPLVDHIPEEPCPDHPLHVSALRPWDGASGPEDQEDGQGGKGEAEGVERQRRDLGEGGFDYREVDAPDDGHDKKSQVRRPVPLGLDRALGPAIVVFPRHGAYF